MKKLTIVVPMYNEQEMIPLFFETINGIVEKIENYQTTILCVNDGSKDNTLLLLKRQKEIQKNLHILSLSRNFGHESAVCAGLKHSKGDIVIVMDADLQDPPELILELIKKYEEGYDVVNAKRVNRKKDPFLKRITAEIFYNVIGKLTGKIKVPNNVGNYRLMSKRVVNYVNELSETNRVFRIEVPYVGFKTTEIEFVRPARPKGTSHYNYGAMIKLAGDSITSSSIVPLRISFILGMIGSVISFICLIVFYILYKCYILSSLGAIFSFVSLWGSLILFFIGIVGEYVGRTLLESQNRPIYYIDEEIQSDIE